MTARPVPAGHVRACAPFLCLASSAKVEEAIQVDGSFVFDVSPYYFLRHGETPESQSGILQGQSNSELNDAGRETAKRAGLQLRGVGIRSLYASPLARTWRTASIVSALIEVPAHPLPGLMERCWGRYEGHPRNQRPSSPDPATVEPAEKFSARVLEAMGSISGPMPLLVVAHSGVFRVLARHAGVAVEGTSMVENGQPFLINPPADAKHGWQISKLTVAT